MHDWYPYLFLAKSISTNMGGKKKRKKAEMEEDNDSEAHLKCLLKCEGNGLKIKACGP